MTAPIQSARDYSLALYGALLAAGIPADHAIDCARNVAQAACLDAEVDVYDAVYDRLSRMKRQAAYGYRASVWPAAGAFGAAARFAEACRRIPRWIEPRDADTSPGGAEVFRPESAR